MPLQGIYGIIQSMSNFFSNQENSNNLFSNSGKSENFFSDIEVSPKSLKEQRKDIESNYEQIFVEAAESIRRELDKIKPQNPCSACSNKDCKIEKKDVFSPYPQNCEYRSWQLKALTFLSGDYKHKLKVDYERIMDKKNEYSCNCCGACCKLAVSEYSYNQLKQRAMKGDKFSEDFVSVFVPFEKEEDAKAINPEYFELLNELVDDRVYYYYCPKLGEDNLCTIYENRPNICKEFPHNPLKLLPSECSFNAWKDEIAHSAMLLKAKSDIINFYKEKLQ